MTKTGERLSVTTAREHVEDGHGGDFGAYCYRCQYFEERDNAAIWELLAIEKRRFWLSPVWPHWTRPVGFGQDEYWRRTVWVGRLVVALWPVRGRAEWVESLRVGVDRDDGQRDRDAQRKAAPERVCGAMLDNTGLYCTLPPHGGDGWHVNGPTQNRWSS